MCNQILALAGIAIYFLTHAMPLSQVAPRMHRWLWTVDTVGYLWFGIFGLDLLRSCVQRRWEGNQASYDARPAKLCSKAALVQRSLRWSSSSSIRSPDPPARIRTMYIDSKQCTVARSVFLVESESQHFQFIECLWFNCRSQRCVLSLPASSGTLRPSLQDLLTALDAGKLASEGKPVAEALASYKAKVRLRTAVGFFRFFALWVFWPSIPFTFTSPYLPYQVGWKDVDAWNQSVVRIKFLVWCLLGLFIHMYSVNYFLVGYLYLHVVHFDLSDYQFPFFLRLVPPPFRSRSPVTILA